jgi:ribosomal protein S18 acetylase RimI-like enzyme
MVHIIYRHYQENDDSQLSDLFNRAFQMNGGGFLRTPKGLNWRYVQSPNFKPEMIQIAEDIDKKLIVGAVYVNLIENVILNGNSYLMGDINDVSCLPEYTQMGIATNLMQMALEYMKKRGCDLSILSADINGIAREKIYLKLGYRDFERGVISFGIPKARLLIKNFPIFIILIPLFLCYSYIPRFIIKIQLKFNSLMKALSYEILHNMNHNRYRDAANKILSKYYNGFPLYSEEKMLWARIQVPAKRHSPTYVLIYKDNRIIGGACITYKNMYAFKYGIKIRVGIIHEIFIEKEVFHSKTELYLGYKYLIDKINQAARERNIGGIFYNGSDRDYDLIRSFTFSSFLNFKAGMVMIKELKRNIKWLESSRPIYIPTYVSLGFP